MLVIIRKFLIFLKNGLKSPVIHKCELSLHLVNRSLSKSDRVECDPCDSVFDVTIRLRLFCMRMTWTLPGTSPKEVGYGIPPGVVSCSEPK